MTLGSVSYYPFVWLTKKNLFWLNNEDYKLPSVSPWFVNGLAILELVVQMESGLHLADTSSNACFATKSHLKQVI